MTADPDLSLVIACYQESGHLLQNVRTIERVLAQTPLTYELIFVEDCSTDDTASRVRQLCDGRSNDRRAIFHSQNQGRGASVSDGIRMARGRVIGFIDIDLEIAAHYIPVMVLAIRDGGYDVATALRLYQIVRSGLVRHILSHSYRRLVRWILNLPLADAEAGCKFFRREAAQALAAQTRHPGWFWDTEIMALAHDQGYRIAEVPCVFVRDPSKRSTVRIWRDSIEYWGNLMAFRAERKAAKLNGKLLTRDVRPET